MGTDRVNRKYLGLLGVVLALILAMVLWPRSKGSGTDADEDTKGQKRAHDNSSPRTANRVPLRRATATSRRKTATSDDRKSSAQQHLERYLKAKQYPPSSGRLTAKHYGLLNWNTRYEKPRFTPDSQTKPPEDQVRYIFTADRYFYQSKQVVHAKLGAWKGDKPISLVILDARAKREGRGGLEGQAVALQFVDQSLTYRCDFSPAVAFPEHHGNILLDVMFEHAGGEVHHAKLRLFYTPDGKIPARFTGSFSDAVEEGSLVIRAGVEVYTKGFYIISANLFDAFDKPVAFTTFKGELKPGDTDVPLLFFGKILHDANGSSPYVMANLRGYRFLNGQYPDRERLSDHVGTYTTDHYQLDVFYDDDWTSDQKEWMLEQLYKAAEDGEKFPTAVGPADEAPPANP